MPAARSPPGVEGWARLAGAGTHPFADPEGELIDDPKYAHLIEEFPWVLPRQLVFGLHVHVAVRGADRALAVHNALRSFLPELAALAGNAPLHAGRDTGLASLRPKICDLLPRQGVPPAWGSWEERARSSAGAAAAASSPAPASPWYELRPHDEVGTIELRVPDSQSTVDDAAGVIALAPGLVAWLAERHDAGEPLPVHEHGRIVENRWRAMRHGLGGSLLDLDSGEPRPTRARIVALIDAVAPAAERLGGAAELEHARTLAARNGAERQRALAAERGSRGVVEWLAGVRSCHEGQRRHSDFRRPSISRTAGIGKAPPQ
jgi:carboxylate-amine ligase